MDSTAAGAVKRRTAQRFRIPIALGALLAWIFITALNPFRSSQPSGLVSALADAPAWGILCAGLFLLVLIAICRWGDLGLNRPSSLKSLGLLWLPALYIVLFLGLGFVLGSPPLGIVAFLLLNTGLAAISEELMFRGVLFSALRTRLRLFWAVASTSVLFGLVHLLNVLVIGNLTIAGAQAVAAAMSGVVFIAIRVRTGSLFPAMALHALWDFSLLMAVAHALSTSGVSEGQASAGAPIGAVVATVALLLPNFFYALFLLRKGDNAKTP